ncbi:MAG: ABC transporter ATP-binding protein [Bacteroidota bacterium]
MSKLSNTDHAPQQPMRRLFRYLGSYKTQLWTASLSSVINKIFDLMPPFLAAWIIDTASGQVPAWIGRWTGYTDPWTIIIFLTVLTLAIFAFESFFEWLYKLGFMRLAQRVQHDLRLFAYSRMQEREIAFFEEQRTGNLMAMLNDDINQLERFLNNSFNEILQLIILLLFAGWSLYITAPTLGLIGMLPIPLIFLGSLFYQRKIAPYYRAIREAVGQLSNRLENNISGMLVIKSFTSEAFERERVSQSSAAYRDANFRAISWSASYIPVIRMLIALGFAATLLLGAQQVLSGSGPLTVGGLAFFAMMIQRLLWPITTLGRVFDEYERARASARRVFGMIDSPNQITSPAEPKEPKAFRGHLQLDQVSFAYQAQQPVLASIDLDIPAGSTIGIAGPTGAGKTTLIKLLLRLYDVNAGSIRFDGVDLREMDLQRLRRQVALVSQDVYLFHGTVFENIAYGLPEADEQAVIRAAKKAKLHGFIDGLPDGYASIIGERGIKLSGGQRQRLSIARAILKEAPVIILDEATSAVDTETERAIQQNLKVLTEGKTAIIIAHRLSTIRQADRIIILKDGKITESGTHDALLEEGGIYADLWNVQLGVLA